MLRTTSRRPVGEYLSSSSSLLEDRIRRAGIGIWTGSDLICSREAPGFYMTPDAQQPGILDDGVAFLHGGAQDRFSRAESQSQGGLPR